MYETNFITNPVVSNRSRPLASRRLSRMTILIRTHEVSNRSRPLASRRTAIKRGIEECMAVSNRSRPLASRRSRARSEWFELSDLFPIDRVP